MLRQTQTYLATAIIAFFLLTSVVVAHHEMDDPYSPYSAFEVIRDANIFTLDSRGYPTPDALPRGYFSVPGDNIFPDYRMTVRGPNGLESATFLNPSRPIEQYPVLLRPGEVRRGNVVHFCPDCDDSTGGYRWDPVVPTNTGFFGSTTTSLNLTRVVVYPESTSNQPSKSGGDTGSNSLRDWTPKRSASISLNLNDRSQRRPGESDYERMKRLNYGPKTRRDLDIAPQTPRILPNQTLMIEHHN